MITNLGKVSSGHPYYSVVPQRASGYAARFVEYSPFIHKISESRADLLALVKGLTCSVRSLPTTTRTMIIPLQNSLEINGKTVRALRLKGVYPRVLENGEVAPYTDGGGTVRRAFRPSGGSEIVVDDIGGDQASSRGTMPFSSLMNEARVARQLGHNYTDLLLGYGFFDGLSYDGEEVGFVIYGMEREDDLRVAEYFKRFVVAGEELPEFAHNIAIDVGSRERYLYSFFFLAHQFSHLGNFALNPSGEVRMVDLDSVECLVSLPVAERMTYMYLDLARTMSELYVPYGNRRDISFASLVPFFLYGYFLGDTSSPFMQEVAKFVSSRSYDEAEFVNVFGRIPRRKEGKLVDWDCRKITYKADGTRD